MQRENLWDELPFKTYKKVTFSEGIVVHEADVIDRTNHTVIEALRTCLYKKTCTNPIEPVTPVMCLPRMSLFLEETLLSSKPLKKKENPSKKKKRKKPL